MKAQPRLKKVADQVIVITGASSGIGLTTARMASRRGAKVVLAARNAPVLRDLADDLRRRGGHAIHVEADVGNAEDVRAIARAAVEAFGHIDTWVNNAGVSIYGELMTVPEADSRRLFETNFWGMVHGSKVAVDHLRTHGGAIINIGGTLADRSTPLQGMHAASKQAVKGYTDALRNELEAAGVPISVTLIKPAAIDTPYAEHARSYLDVAPKSPSPVYAPEVVADAILRAAEHPIRDLYAGGGAKGLARASHTNERRGYAVGALYQAGGEGRERGGHKGVVFERSIFTSITKHPLRTALVALGLALGVHALRARAA